MHYPSVLLHCNHCGIQKVGQLSAQLFVSFSDFVWLIYKEHTDMSNYRGHNYRCKVHNNKLLSDWQRSTNGAGRNGPVSVSE